MESDLEIFRNGQINWEMAKIDGARLKYLKNGLTKLEIS